MNGTRLIVASGALWAVVYNFTWGIAWFGFMRSEWERAMAAVGRPVPFTAEVWFEPMGRGSDLHLAARTHALVFAGTLIRTLP